MWNIEIILKYIRLRLKAFNKYMNLQYYKYIN